MAPWPPRYATKGSTFFYFRLAFPRVDPLGVESAVQAASAASPRCGRPMRLGGAARSSSLIPLVI
eukprot:scaffold123865_cov32-Tisochrysis_lutea.AAC.1